MNAETNKMLCLLETTAECRTDGNLFAVAVITNYHNLGGFKQ